MFKKNLNNHRCSGPGCNQQGPMFTQQGYYQGMMNGVQNMQPNMQPEGAIFPQVQEDRLQFEIRENRRRINNLTRRIIRLENYLRIRDTSEYASLDDDQIPNEFTM